MKAWIFLVLLCASVLLPGLGALTLERQQELRVSLVARSMAEGGRWLIPEFQRQPRLRKPPLMYWVTAVSLKVADTPFMARLPSALSGTGLVVLIYGFGSTVAGRRRGLLSALAALTSLLFLRHARLAETDMTLCLFTSLAVFMVYLIGTRGSKWAYPALGVFAGLGFMTKGPAAVAIPLLMVLYMIFRRVEKSKKNLPPRGTFHWGLFCLAVGLFILIAAPWYVYIRSYSDILATELSATFVKTEHAGSPLYYLYTVPKLFPLAILLPWIVARCWKMRHHEGIRFTLVWFAGVLVLLSVTPSKQSHYAVLLLPSIAVLLGTGLGAFYVRVRKIYLVLALVAALAITSGLVYGIYPRVHPESKIPGFITETMPLVAADQHLHVVGVNSAIFEYYAHRRVENIDSVNAAWRRAAKGEVILVIQKEKRLDAADLPKVEADRDFVHRGMRYIRYVKGS